MIAPIVFSTAIPPFDSPESWRDLIRQAKIGDPHCGKASDDHPSDERFGESALSSVGGR
jgi:hypothetical protein